MAVLFLSGDYLGQEENIRNASKLKHLNIPCIDIDYGFYWWISQCLPRYRIPAE